MTVTNPSLPRSLSVYLCLTRSLSLQPYHILHRYAPNHSLAKQWHTQHLPFLFSPSSFLSVVLVTVYATLRRLLTSPPFPPSLSCGDCEWSKHALSHTSSPARLGTAEEMMHPVDTLRSRRQVREMAGRQVESWVDLASLKTKESETCPNLKIAVISFLFVPSFSIIWGFLPQTCCFVTNL